MKIRSIFLSSVVIIAALLPNHGSAQEVTAPAAAKPVKTAKLGETRNVHRCGDLYLAGQFSPQDIEKIKAAGITRVISLRTDGEIDWDQKTALDNAGLEFIVVPFRAPQELTDDVFDKVRKLLDDSNKPTLFHCGSANRVGGVWMTRRVLDEGIDMETAVKEAKTIGLRNAEYEQKARDYIERKKKAEKGNKPPKSKDINASFLDPDMDVEAFVKRFEIDNREVYAARKEVLRALNLKAGNRVADVGAGTGLYTHLFADEVGDSGWIFAVDISPKFLAHIKDKAASRGTANITSVLCREDSVDLPPESIDVAYVCDTYHHFAYPAATTQSIYNALRPGGELVVVDFERIPGKSREWLLGHVRAGKEVVRKEIEDTGFAFVEETAIPGLNENYFLRFKKQASR